MRKGSSGFPVTCSRWVGRSRQHATGACISEAMAPFRDQLKLVDGIPGVGPRRRGDHHRRNRRRHDPLPQRRTPGILGRRLPRHERIRRPTQTRPHPPRQPMAHRRTRHRSLAAARTKDTTFIGARYRRLAGGTGRLRPSSRSNTRSSPPDGTCCPRTSSTTSEDQTVAAGHSVDAQVWMEHFDTGSRLSRAWDHPERVSPR
jgi:hypothetical protein